MVAKPLKDDALCEPITFVAITDVGMQREVNEDSVLAIATADRKCVVLLVADGVGGHERGEVASKIARDVVELRFGEISEPINVDTALSVEMHNAATQANDMIFALSSAESSVRPATTFTLCIADETHYEIIHVGDTRAYHIAGSLIRQLTEDDTWVAAAVRNGEMSELEAVISPIRHQLTKALGMAETAEFSNASDSWRPNDILVLCSDGLSEYLSSTEIAAEMRRAESLQDACESLVKQAASRGGQDNISVAAARNDSASSVGRAAETWPGTTACHIDKEDSTYSAAADKRPIWKTLHFRLLLLAAMIALLILAIAWRHRF